MKKDAYYFPHFSNARNDTKILKLRRVMGIEGYGMYFMLLEVLREQSDFRYPVNGIEDLAYEWHTSKEKIAAVVTNFDLFTITDVDFFSIKQVQYLQPYLEKTKRARDAANERWSRVDMQMHSESDANALQMQSKCNADKNARKGEERKVKESKVKESIEEVVSIETPTHQAKQAIKSLEDRIADFKSAMWVAIQEMETDFFKVNNYINAKSFFDYWTEHGPNDKKARWEKEKTFGLNARLGTWERRDTQSAGGQTSARAPHPSGSVSFKIQAAWEEQQARDRATAGAMILNKQFHDKQAYIASLPDDHPDKIINTIF